VTRAGVTYLDNACMGLPHPAGMREARKVLDMVEGNDMSATDLVVTVQTYYDRARDAAARLVNATPAEMALVESTTHGLGLVAAALPLEPGDNVVVCDLEFLPTVLCWRTRQAGGLEVREVRSRAGRVEPADFEARMDARTRALVVSSVQEINGFRADVAALAVLARASGAWLLVDGVQEAGALRADVRALGVDVYCCGGHKWLRNPFGMGFLYVRKEMLEAMSPAFYGYFNLDEPAAGWGPYLASPERSPFDPLTVLPGAQRFETGGYGNYVGAAALWANLEAILAEVLEAIERRTLALGERLAKGLDALGLEVRSPREAQSRSGITTFGLPGGVEEELKFSATIEKKGVFVSVGYTSGVGGIRVSPHHHNSIWDVDRLPSETEEIMKHGAFRA
jgi:cysteine desulfurase/selenocysteine lyase